MLRIFNNKTRKVTLRKHLFYKSNQGECYEKEDCKGYESVMKKKIAKVIVETLESYGVKNCYGISGDTLNLITNEIHKSTIRWVHTRHEEVAAFAAGAEALFTGNLTVCAGSCGPESLHLINGVHESHRNGAPIIVLASQLTTNRLCSVFPQQVDFTEVYKGCSVFCEQINRP